MQENDKKYKMLENDNMSVKAHIDPGLFSISFIQNNMGIQLLERNRWGDEWSEIPLYNDGVYGIIWTGQYKNSQRKNFYNLKKNKKLSRILKVFCMLHMLLILKLILVFIE